MTWLICRRRFIAEEGNLRPGQMFNVRDDRRVDFLVSSGYAIPEEVSAVLPFNSWMGESVAIFAGGPSMTQADADYCRRAGVRRICVNDSYRLALDADMIYACDKRWWDTYKDDVRARFPGYRVTRDPEAAQKYGLRYIRSDNLPGLTKDPCLIHEGGNSGYQAINLAYIMGAKRIVLLGYDMSKDGPRSHWFGQHPGQMEMPSPYAVWIAKFEQLAADCERSGIKVVNCSRRTALPYFERMPLEWVL